jgi:hypothetical protein
VLRKEEYVSKSEVKTKEDLKAVAETGFSLTPPGRAYVIGKTTVDLLWYFYYFLLKRSIIQ